MEVKILEIQKVPVSHSVLWLRHGVRLILRSPLHAVGMAVLFALSVLAALMVPFIGMLLAMLLMPVLMAGYLRACRALEYSEPVLPEYFMAGFRQRTQPLMALGGMLLMGMLLISIVTMLLGGEALNTLQAGMQQQENPQALLDAMLAPGSGMLPALLAGLFLLFVLMMAFQYAPMLVFFNGMMPVDAFRASMVASLRNILPMLVYSFLMQLLAFVVGVLPYGLGWLILLPLGLTSVYVSYRDIFTESTQTISGSS